ncbi:MAG: helix-turn-helix domain-containing protein, partial [Gemmatimonadota bacterium]
WDGVCRYDGRTFERVPGIGGCSVLALRQTSDGAVWAGTNEGLVRILDGEATAFSQDDGLPCDIVTAVEEDEAGTLWIGTEGGGVCRYDGQVFQTIALPGDAHRNVVRSIRSDGHGRHWLGTGAGLVRYAPAAQAPSVAVERVVADREYDRPSRVEIPATAARIRFHFSGRSGDRLGGPVVYRYRLHDADRGWRCTRQGQVEYADLAPGRYRFLLQAVDSDLNYSEIAEVRLTLRRDPWLELLDDRDPSEVAPRSETVLVIDGEAAVGEACRRYLVRRGLRARFAAGADQALRELESGDVDLVLLDVGLGDSGSLLRRIRQHRPSPEVIVLADFGRVPQASHTTRIGARAYVTKPCDPRQLLDEIDRALALRCDPMAAYIRARIGEIESREELATRFGVSSSTVGNHVRRVTGLSFSDFLQACRVEEAQRLLLGTDLDVQQVAARAGITPAAFSRLFRRITGMPPREFRQAARFPVP